MSRNVKIATVAVVIVAVAVALITSLAQGSSGSPLDAGLKAGAGRLAKSLHQPDLPYEQTSFLNGFNLFQHQEQTVLQSGAKSGLKTGQFAQIAVYETKTMPPVFRELQVAGKPTITISGDLLGQVANGKAQFTTVHQGNLEFRGYLTRLQVPAPLADSGTHEVLEVFQAQT